MAKYKEPKINITKVYTKLGDSGTTHLIGGEQVLKDDPRVCAYGNVEEILDIPASLVYPELASRMYNHKDQQK